MDTNNVSSIEPEYMARIKHKIHKRETSFQALKNSHGNLTNVEAITNLPFFELRSQLQNKTLTATKDLKAYTAKALSVNDELNCITEFVPWAKKRAMELDESEQLGPLHGIPFAVKDDLDVEGMDTTVGFAKYLDRPASESAALVQTLQKLGAIPFCKTNVPQSLLSFGCDNPIFGKTKNGLNQKLSCGGSSGGSGSLVAACGALFATGSDYGGSLRIPAHYNGLATIKCTTNRLSEKGLYECSPLVTHRSVPGIIAPDVKTLSFIMKCLTEDNIQNQFDPLAFPVPWNDSLFQSSTNLRIGYFTSLPSCPAWTDTQNTVLKAKDALLARGHEVKPFKMPEDDAAMMKMIMEHFSMDGFKSVLDKFEGEPLAECMEEMITGIRRATNMGFFGGKSGTEALENIYYKRQLTLDVLRRMEEAQMDLLLCPVLPHPAIKLEFGHKINQAAAVYTIPWNFVHFPAGVVKFGRAEDPTAFDQKEDPYWVLMKDGLEESTQMPIGVQIVGKPFQEELVLRAMLELEEIHAAETSRQSLQKPL